MGIIEYEEAVAFVIDNEVVCKDCAKNNELKELKPEDVVYEKNADGKLIFCDRCKEKLN